MRLSRSVAIAGVVCLLVLAAGIWFAGVRAAAGGKALAPGQFEKPNPVMKLFNRVAPSWFPIAAPMMAPSGPGGVGTNLKVWNKADAGISAGDGAGVGQWINQANPGYILEQPVTTSRPTYYSTTASQLANFNPVLHYDGADFIANNTRLMAGTSQYTFLLVGQDEDTGTGYRKILSSEDAFDWFGLYKQGGAVADNGWIPYGISGVPDRGTMGKGTKYSSAGGANGFYNGTNFTSDARTDHAQPQIVGFNSINTATSDPMFTWVDGYKENPGWSFIKELGPQATHHFAYLAAGADYNGSAGVEHWLGKINEVIVYDRSLTDAEIQKINTYLAIKWGVTLGQGNGAVGNNGGNYDYVASDGTVAWAAAANSTYKYDIAGIGRDDASGLNQKQSASVNLNNILTIGSGTIAASNAANSNNFGADKSFEIWGHDNAGTAYGTAVGGTNLNRMTRIWKVQETGTVGNVVVRIPVSATIGSMPALVRGTDTTFDSSDTLVMMTLNGANYEATIDFANGDFFTFAAFAASPGGVGGTLGLWLRADAGASTTTNGAALTSWTDQGPNGRHATQTVAAEQPDFRNDAQNQFNYNPTIKFAGNQDLVNTTMPLLNKNAYTIFSVTRRDSVSNYPGIFSQNQGANTGQPGTTYLATGNSIGLNAIDQGATNVSVVDPLMGYFLLSNIGGAANALTISMNGGSPIANGTYSWGQTGAVLGYYVARHDETLSNSLIGNIAEVAVYSSALSGAQLQAVESYFGVKYGLTLAHDYFASDGTTIWDVGGTGGFDNDIAGIGRDDVAALNQKQSRSVAYDDMVTIGLGTVAADNLSNPNAFAADKRFMLWGNDNGGTATMTAVPSSSLTRMGRIWRVQETGAVGNVRVRIPAGALGAGPVLLRSADTTIDNTDTQVPLTLSGNYLEATVDFSSGEYFTFAGTGVQRPRAGATGYETDGITAGANPAANTPTCNPKQFWEHQVLVEKGAFSGFAAGQIQGGQTGNESTHLADINGDGKLDIIWIYDAGGANGNSGTYTWLGNGDGTFQHAAIRDTGNFDGGPLFPGFIPAGGDTGNETTFVADANNDGKIDIIWVYDAGGGANAGTWVWLGNGDGTFQHKAIIDQGHLSGSVPGYTYSIFGGYTANESTHLVDTNNDGKLDVVLLYDHGAGASSGSRVYLGNGNGTWNKTPIVDIGWAGGVGFAFSAAGGETANESTYIVDIDNDGNVDVVWVYDFGRGANSGTYMWKGLGDGTFNNTPVEDHGLTDPFYTWSAAGGQNGNESTRIVDVNRDGNLDILWLWDAGGATNTAGSYVWLGNGNGTYNHTPVVDAGGFNAYGNFMEAGIDPYQSTLVGDLNGDGMPDITWSYEGGANSGAYVYLGKDSDSDGLADVVDTDDDGDGTPDASDACMAPGAVLSGLQLWMKADKGASVDASNNFTLWADQSTFGRDANLVFGDPQRIDAALNFNPTVRFDGDDYFRFGINAFVNTYTAGEVFAVQRTNTYTTCNCGQSFDFGNGNRNSHYTWGNGAIYEGFGTNDRLGWDPIAKTTTADPKPGVASITGPSVDPRVYNIYSVHSAANDWGVSFNGTGHVSTTTNTASFALAGGNEHVGAVAGYIFNGDLSEVILYNRTLSATERKQVESYLGTKYGITVGHDYVASDGTTKYWDMAANSAYHNDVAGIGLDIGAMLNQKQSASINPGNFVSIGLGTIAATNQANPNNFAADKRFMVWGNDGATTTLSTPYAPLGATFNRMPRVWKAQETGTVGQVLVSVPAWTSVTHMLVSGGASFSGGVTEIAMTPDGNGNMTALFDFSTGQFFTFGGVHVVIAMPSASDGYVTEGTGSGPNGYACAGPQFWGHAPIVDQGMFTGTPPGSPANYIQGGISAAEITLSGDVNGDGKPDIVWIYEGGGAGTAVWLSNGNGTFAHAAIIDKGLFTGATNLPGGPNIIQAGVSGNESTFLADVSGDGKLDIVWTYDGGGAAANSGTWVWLGNGNGTWQHTPVVDYGLFASGAIPGGANILQAGLTANESSFLIDTNGDGKLDLVWIYDAGGAPASSGTWTWLGNGNGTWQHTPIVDQGGFVGHTNVLNIIQGGVTGNESTHMLDVNTDGIPDIIWIWDGGGNTTVNGTWTWLGNGNGTWQHQPIIDTGLFTGTLPSGGVDYIQGGFTGSESTRIADINADGKPDIVWVVEGAGNGGTAVWLGKGNGTWQHAALSDRGMFTGTPPQSGANTIQAGLTGNETFFMFDANGDKALDIVWVIEGAGNGGTAVWLAGCATIAGNVFEDKTGNSVADDAVIDDAAGDQQGRNNANVCLFQDNGDGVPNASDSLVSCQLTSTMGGSIGAYQFSGVATGQTYWVVTQASTVTPSGGGTGLPEQVHGSVGGQCGGATLAAGDECYGGKGGAAADGFTGTAATLVNAEHVIKVGPIAGNVTGGNFGFSFNVVTNTNISGQGSLAQFIGNANTGTGANAMRFVPAVATNQTVGLNSWWRVSQTSALPMITDALTTIDGTAYDKADGLAVLNPNNATLGAGGTVGRNSTALGQLNGPEFEVKGPGNNSVGIGLDVQANTAVIRKLAIFGFGANTATSADIRVGASAASAFTGDLIELNVIGAAANGFTDPGAGSRSTGLGVFVTGADTGMIQNNLIGFHNFSGLALGLASDNVNGWQVLGNEVRGNAITQNAYDGITSGNNTGAASVIGNLITGSGGFGIDQAANGSGWTITDNTITANGVLGAETAGIRYSNTTSNTATLIQDNVITSNPGAGVTIPGAANSDSVKISTNIFGSNGSNAIDLGNNGVSLNTSACAATGTGGANGDLARPTLTASTLVGTTLTVSGTYCATGTYDIEFYKSSANGSTDKGTDNLDAGEGIEYIGKLTGQTGGAFTGQAITLPGGSTLTTGDAVTAIVIRTDGAAGIINNTSEFSVNKTVVTGATLTKAFAPASIPVNTASMLTFTLTNSGGNPQQDGIGFTDAFSAPVIVATPLTATNTCGGTLQDNSGGALAAGDVGVKLVGGTIASGTGSCTITVNVTAPLGGPYPNDSTNIAGLANLNNGVTLSTLTVVNAADLAVTKTDGVTSVSAGGSTVYTVVFSNTGPSSATGVAISDPIPAGVTGFTWTCTAGGGAACPAGSGTGAIGATVDLPAGGSLSYAVTAAISTLATGSIANTATITHALDPNTANNSVTDTDTLTTNFDLAITKVASATFTAGGSGQYQINVNNSGPSNSTGTTTVAETMPAGISAYAVGAASSPGWSCTGAVPNVTCTNSNSIPASGTSLLALDVTLAPSAPNPLASNNVTVSNPGDGNAGNNGGSSGTTPVTQSFDLQLAKTTVGQFTSGGSGQYKLTVTNAGPSDSSGTTTVGDSLPAGITAYSINAGSTAGWSCSGTVPSVTCTNANVIAAGANSMLILDVTLSPTAPNPLPGNVATVSNPNECVTCTSNNGPITTPTTPLSSVFDLTATKTVNSTFTLGGTGQYKITVSNAGPSNSTGTTTVTETLPAGVTAYAVNAGSNGGWACTGTVPNVSCSNPNAIPASGSITLLLDVTISPAATSPLAANSITISNPSENAGNTGNNGPVTSGAPTPLATTFDLTIGKSASSTFTLGSSGQYMVTVHNNGPSNSTGTTTVNETMPAGVTAYAVNAGSTAGWSCTGSVPNVTCTNANSIPTGVDSMLLLDITISAGASNPLPANSVSISNPNECGACTGNNGPATTPPTSLSSVFDLSVTKVAQGTFTSGGSGQYKITITNNGPSNSTGTTTVDETFPTGITAYSINAGSTAGWSCSGTVPSVLCTNVNPIASGANSMLIFDVTISPSAPNPLGSNVVAVTNPAECPTCGGNNGPLGTPTTPLAMTYDLTMTKAAQGVFTAGGAGQYKLTVSNAGPSNSSGTTTITDTLPAGVTAYTVNVTSSPGWSCSGSVPNVTCTNSNSVLAGGNSMLILDVTISGGASNPLPANLASMNNAGDSNTGNNGATSGTTPLNIIFDLAVAKTATAPFTAGGTGQYTIVVTNSGASNSTGTTTVTETFPTGITGYTVNAGSTPGWSCTGAAPNATCTNSNSIVGSGGTSTLILDVNVSPSASNPLAGNIVAVSNPGECPTCTGGNGPITTAPTPTGSTFDLTIAKVAQGTFTAGGSGQYKITVSNAGPSDSTGTTTVTETLPTGVTAYAVNAGSSPGWSCTGTVPNVSCTNSSMISASGNIMLLLDVTLAANAPNPLPANTVAVTNPGDPTPPPAVTTPPTPVANSFDLSIAKASQGVFTAGAGGQYKITVSNAGPSDSTGTTTVADTLPAGVTGYSVNGGSTGSWSCTGTVPNVSCTTTSTVPASGNLMLLLDVTLAANAPNPLQPNMSSVSNPGDATPGNNGPATSGATTVASTFDLTIAKAAQGTFTAGGSGQYKITVSNAGPSDSTGVTTVGETLPAGITGYSVNAGSTAGWSCSGSVPNVTCTNSNLIAASGNSMLLLDVQLDPNAPNPLAANSASVSNPNECQGLTGGALTTCQMNGPVTNPTTPPLATTFNLTTTKSALGAFTAGGTGMYQITVNNAGPSNSSGTTTVNETLPAGITGYSVGGASSPGWSCTGSVPSVVCTNASSIPASGSSVLFLTVNVASNASGSIGANTVSVSNPNECGTCGGDNGPATSGTTPVSTSFDLGVTKTTVGTFTSGGAGQYKMTVTNNGPSDSSGVTTLNDLLPAGITAYSINASSSPGWNCSGTVPGVSCVNPNVIAAGANSMVVMDVTISATAPNPLGGNQVTISNPNECPTCTTDNGPISIPPTTLNSSFDLSVVKVTQGAFTLGGTGQYKITVTNNGPSNSSGITTVTETLAAGITGYSVNAGSTAGWTCTGAVPNVSCENGNAIASSGNSMLLLDVTISPNATSPLGTNTVSISNPSECAGCTTGNGPVTSGAPTPLATTFDLTVAKSASSMFVAGGTGQYTITVHNNGPSNSTGATTVNETMPAGVTGYSVAASSTAGWSCSGTVPGFTCTNSSSIPSGGDSLLILNVTLSAGAANPLPANTVAISNPNECAGCAAGNGPVTTPPTALNSVFDLSATKTANTAFTAGGTGQYKITVTNNGPSNSTGTTTVDETLPAGATAYSVNAGSTTGWTCTGTVPDVTCTNPNVINAGANSMLLLDVTLAANAPNPLPSNIFSISNPAECASCTTDNGPIVTPPIPTTTTFDLSMTKQSVGAFTAGGSGQYKITVSNKGPSNSTGTTTVTETLPAGITAYAVNPISSPGWNCSGSVPNVSCANANSIAAGGNSILLLDVTLAPNAPNPLAGNSASLSNPNECPTCGAGNGPVTTPTTPVSASFDLTVAKAASGAFAAAGAGQYQITVSNAGPSDSTGTTTVTDTLPAGIAGYSVNPSSTSGWACLGSVPNIACTNSAAIPSGGSSALVLDVTLSPSAPNPLNANTAQASNPNECPTCTSNNGPATSGPTPVMNVFDLGVTKTVQGTFLAGGTGQYRVTVSNAGPSDSTGVTTLAETFPTGISAYTIDAASSPGWTCAGTVCRTSVAPTATRFRRAARTC